MILISCSQLSGKSLIEANQSFLEKHKETMHLVLSTYGSVKTVSQSTNCLKMCSRTTVLLLVSVPGYFK
ncbi:hypothetical protein GW17_00003904 [Ensete ventricosum]|nr:hypothetical protein GW17_00003904 [Ensete ventricosum]